MPTVSVIMPIGPDDGRYVGEAVESLRRQSFDDWELIARPDVDAGWVPDETDRVRVLDAADESIPAARNACLDAATGGYVAWDPADNAEIVASLRGR